MAVFNWSQTAATNATADGSINWAEGQAPSSVNDSARAMMAALAKYFGDISGAITTGGTSTAYTVASNSTFDTLAHMSNQLIAFVPHATNGGGGGTQVTLNVDGLGAKAIRFAPSVNIESGTLIQGTPYVATYNNSDAAFYLHAPSPGPWSIPLGAMVPYTGSTAPNTAFVLPFGQAISRTTYATYFSLVSTTYGVGDGSTTFNVIDMRGRLPIGQDNMGGVAASRTTTAGSSIDGATVGASGGTQNVMLAQANLPNVTLGYGGATGSGGGASAAPTTTAAVDWNSSANKFGASPGTVVTDITGGDTNTSAVSRNQAGQTSSLSGAGAQTVVNKMPPGIVVPYILRVI